MNNAERQQLLQVLGMYAQKTTQSQAWTLNYKEFCEQMERVFGVVPRKTGRQHTEDAVKNLLED